MPHSARLSLAEGAQLADDRPPPHLGPRAATKGDRPADFEPHPAAADQQRDQVIAVIGTGPRGISVLERIGARLLDRRLPHRLTIYAIDADEVGSGRIWRAGQPFWLAMNNRSGEVTIFSGPADDRAWRPGAGPSFSEWWQRTDVRFPGSAAYAPRSLYGRYLHFVLDVVETNLPRPASLIRIPGFVQAIRKRGERFEVELREQTIECDHVIICNGHPRPRPDRLPAHDRLLAQHDSSRNTNRPDSALIPPGSSVGIIGLGLTFHDVLAALTVGRGGRFVSTPDNDFEYVPSGEEPGRIVAGSRGAFPIPARGDAQRPFDFRYAPRLFTAERIAELRSTGPLDFRADLLPWLEAEANLVFWERRLSPHQFALLMRTLPRAPGNGASALTEMRHAAAALGCNEAINFDELVRPFGSRVFPSQEAFRREFLLRLSRDINEAAAGEIYGPLKAAMEVLRDVRPIIRAAVDFGGLSTASHRDFIHRTGPVLAFLSTGPSAVRNRHLIALIRSGLLEILGPGTLFEPRDDDHLAHSPAVPGFAVRCAYVVDARVPNTDLDQEGSLAKVQREAGAWRPHVRPGDPPLETGGIDVTPPPFNPIAANGEIEPRMYVIGIPTESTRWFMQVGIGRPGPWGEFFRDADAVAEAALRDVGPDDSTSINPAAMQDDMGYCFDP